eukprot:10960155-Alexandrium_andersonii.AAC.1
MARESLQERTPKRASRSEKGTPPTGPARGDGQAGPGDKRSGAERKPRYGTYRKTHKLGGPGRRGPWEPARARRPIRAGWARHPTHPC